MSGYQIVTQTGSTDFDVSYESTVGVQADCPTGKLAVGGGGSASIVNNPDQTLDFFENADLSQSYPATDVSWEADFSRLDGQNFDTVDQLNWTVFVVCVDGTAGG